MNLKKCSDEKLARIYKNQLRRRDLEMEELEYDEDNTDPELDELNDDFPEEYEYECSECGELFTIAADENGAVNESEVCPSCGRQGYVI